MGKQVLVVGGGGREHALAWKLIQSPRVGKVYVAPGNGMPVDDGESVRIDTTNLAGLAVFAEQNNVDLTIVGPDEALACGLVDVFRERGLKIFGPTKAASEIEWSKVFTKNFMADEKIPTAPFAVLRDYRQALNAVRGHGAPVVIKASGLARGKGSYICNNLTQAEEVLHRIMVEKVHGNAGHEVVMEDFVDGNEFSVHALSDGKNFKMFPASQDYKRLMDGDAGPNTGGMGAFAPVPWIEEFSRNSSYDYWISHRIIEPAILGLEKRGRPFVGCLYPGLKGWKVLEFNSRFGDPEAEVYMRLLKTDLLDLIDACIEGRLDQAGIEWFPGYAVCVVMASKGYGYSESFPTCLPVNGIGRAQQIPGVIVFYAGTSRDFVGNINTAGGRVLAVTCHAETLKKAVENVYEAVRQIHFPGAYYRRDIAKDAIKK